MYATTAEQHRAAETRELAATLYFEHYHDLRGIAQSNCGHWAEVEDAVQEAFAIFIAEYDPAAGSPPLPWLALTLRRLGWATTGRRRMAARLGIAGTGYGPDTPMPDQARSRTDTATAVERSEQARRTRAAIKRLPAEQRRALSLLALGYSYREIAQSVGLSEKQVDHRLQGARAALRVG